MSCSHDSVITMFHCLFIVFSLFFMFPCHPMMSSDQNIPFSFHCFENLTILHAMYVLKILLFSMPCIQSYSMLSYYVPVIRIFHCLLMYVLKILLFSMPCIQSYSMLSYYVPVIGIFHCLLIFLKISLFSMSFNHDPVIRFFIVFSPCHLCYPILLHAILS